MPAQRVAAAWTILLRSIPKQLRSSSTEAYAGLPENVAKAARAIGKALENHGIPYALAGAVAANAHGYLRATRDVDVLLNREDLCTAVESISGRGWTPRYAGSRRSFKDAENGVDVDFLVSGEFPGDGKPKPVAFPSLAPQRGGIVPQKVDGLCVLPLVDLIELKLASGSSAAGRMKDLADVQELIKANRLPREFVCELNYSVKETFARLWDEVNTDQRKGLL